jgi:hypothetical protein
MNDANHDNAFEDLGYRRTMEENQVYHLVRQKADKVKIKYIKGDWKGQVKALRRDFAEDLISRGMAKEEL